MFNRRLIVATILMIVGWVVLPAAAGAKQKGKTRTKRDSSGQKVEEASIDRLVRQIDRAKLPRRQFYCESGTDGGSDLIFYGTKQQPGRIRWRVVSCTCEAWMDYYFENGKLALVRLQTLRYPVKDGELVRNDRKLSKVQEERLYFRGGRLIERRKEGLAWAWNHVDAGDEQKLAAYLLRHWNEKNISLESWVQEGKLPDK